MRWRERRRARDLRRRVAGRRSARGADASQELPDRQREAHGRCGSGRSVLHGRGTGESGRGSLAWTGPDRDQGGCSRQGELLRCHAQSNRRGRSAGPRAEELLRAALEQADRRDDQGDRGAVRRHPHQGDRRAPRQVRSARRDRRVARLDSRVRRPRGDHPDRRPRREVQGEGDLQRPASPLPPARQVQGKDVGLLRRRRRLEPLLPEGHLRQPEAAAGVQGEVQARPAPAQVVGGVHRDVAVHHRPARAEGLRRRRGSGARQPRQPVLLLPGRSATSAASSSTRRR